jgi:hypothetical protein
MSLQIEPDDVERIRERIRKTSDAELRKYGRAARDLSNPKKNLGPPNPPFKIQLDELRAEWRRRHPIHRDAGPFGSFVAAKHSIGSMNAAFSAG